MRNPINGVRMTLYEASKNFHDAVVSLFNVICEEIKIEKVAMFLKRVLG